MGEEEEDLVTKVMLTQDHPRPPMAERVAEFGRAKARKNVSRSDLW